MTWLPEVAIGARRRHTTRSRTHGLVCRNMAAFGAPRGHEKIEKGKRGSPEEEIEAGGG